MTTTSKAVVVEKEIGGRTMRIETGQIAKLASGYVLMSHGETAVGASLVRADPRPGLDFFPMQVDYREKLSAGGKFPGGFRKREGAPNEKEVLTMRMIDRPIRPLFPDGFIEEIQIQCWVMSHDGENDADVIAGSAASAVLAISDAPFEGPTATVRVGRIHTEDGIVHIINPTNAQLEFSDIDLVIAGHKDGINMIEVGAAEVPDEEVLEAIRFGYENGVQPILELIDELVSKVGKEKRLGDHMNLVPDDVMAEVTKLVEKELTEARKIKSKNERGDKVGAIKKAMLEEHFQINESGTPGEWEASKKRRGQASEAFRKLEKKITRRLIIQEGTRADGRAFDEIRPLEMEVSKFPRTHGSAMFQRGETQSLVTCTLGTGRDEQVVDGLMPEYSKKFYLHYNFPPFCVGEAGRIMGPGRREVGHGALAERSLLGVLPSAEDFPYTIRIVSDITESNGSSSMASVCGGCLALMDAGVPITNTCAGISVGRFTDDNDENEVFVTDIIGEEDFFGDMDFKVSGTRDGITGIQLDLKARGLVMDQIETIFAQANKGRIELIEAMEETIPAPREKTSKYAPMMIQLNIDVEKIGKLIGPGGKTIRALQDKYDVNIDVEDDGTVMVSSTNRENVENAEAEISALCEDVRPGTIYEGKVVSTKDFGAFIEIAPGTDGMCHISELADGYVESVADVVSVGDIVKVKVMLVDDQGRIKLSIKRADPNWDEGKADAEKKARREKRSDDSEGDSEAEGSGDGEQKSKKKRRRRKPRRKDEDKQEAASAE
ncbi:MAG: polyribonucleotide nucleotidyltransferase [Phycisphaerales bacterium]|nr:polyribonucleotide nucleotidyltransferase [Phycisphaerales bacterium]